MSATPASSIAHATGAEPASGSTASVASTAMPMHEDVADRADAGALAQRDPGEQDGSAGEDDDGAEREAGAVRDALVEDVPRIETEAGADLQRHARAVEDEAGVELDEAAGRAVHGPHGRGNWY